MLWFLFFSFNSFAQTLCRDALVLRWRLHPKRSFLPAFARKMSRRSATIHVQILPLSVTHTCAIQLCYGVVNAKCLRRNLVEF